MQEIRTVDRLRLSWLSMHEQSHFKALRIRTSFKKCSIVGLRR